MEIPAPREAPFGFSAATNGCYKQAIAGAGISSSTGFGPYLFGMTPQQVVQLLGPPAQQHYGKASRLTLSSQQLLEAFRLEMLYPNKGRLVFGVSPQAQRGCSGLRVQFIIHNPAEPSRMKRENAHLYAYDGPPPTGAIPTPPPGMNAAGEVVDTWKVELGYGRSLREKRSGSSTELDQFVGEVFGKAAPDSLFTSIQVGMPCGIALRTMEQEPDAVLPAPPGLRRMLDGQNADYHALVFKGMGVLIAREVRMGPTEIMAILNNANEPVPGPSVARSRMPGGCVHRYIIQDSPPRR
jgi:hypothetical protein